MAITSVSKSNIRKMTPLSRAEKVRREELVAFLRTYKSDDPERAKLLREKHKHLDINLLDEEAYEKAMEEERRAKSLSKPLKLEAETPEQRQLQASGQPFSLRAWFEAGPDVIDTDSKRGGPTPAPREGLAAHSKIPKSELNSGNDSGVELQSSPRKSHSEKESRSKATSSIPKASEGRSSVQNPSVAPKEGKLTPGEKNQISPAIKSANSTPRRGLAVIEKAAARRPVLAAPEKAELQEASISDPSKPGRKLDQAHARLSSQPQKTFTETESAVVLESARSIPRGAEHKGSLMAQAELERKNKRAQEKLQRERERAQDKLKHKNARAKMNAFPTPRFSFIKTEQPVVPTSGLDAPVKRERSEGSCFAARKTFIKTEKPVMSASGLDAPVKRERNEGSCSASPKADLKPEQAQSNRSSTPQKAFANTARAVVLPFKAEQRIGIEVGEIRRNLRDMTGPQEVLAARIVGALAGPEYLVADGTEIRMDPKHPLPRKAHDALLDFSFWGRYADEEKAETLISKYNAVAPAPKSGATPHVNKPKREGAEEQVPERDATFKAPGIKRKRVENEMPAPQSRKAEALTSKFNSQEATATFGASTYVVKRKRDAVEEPASKKRKREEDEAPPPKKQKSQSAAEKENTPRQLPSFVHRHGETETSSRNLTWVEDTLYGRRRIQVISHNVRAPTKS